MTAPLRRWIAAAGMALAATVFLAEAVAARSTPDTLPEAALSSLPTEAQDVLASIRKGGPFHYERDGVVFGNREQILPSKPRGHYHEYTVRTPGVKGRGARRIVCGGPAAAPGICYYTDDHYRKFRRIRE